MSLSAWSLRACRCPAQHAPPSRPPLSRLSSCSPLAADCQWHCLPTEWQRCVRCGHPIVVQSDLGAWLLIQLASLPAPPAHCRLQRWHHLIEASAGPPSSMPPAELPFQRACDAPCRVQFQHRRRHHKGIFPRWVHAHRQAVCLAFRPALLCLPLGAGQEASWRAQDIRMGEPLPRPCPPRRLPCPCPALQCAVVWASSTLFACAAANCPAASSPLRNGRDWVLVSCQYWPPGNVANRHSTNVRRTT